MRARSVTPSLATAASSAANRLAAGTLALEGTELAVTPESAANLLPLWQLMDQLQSSGSAAPEEITAVVEQIRINMTTEQLKVMDGMTAAGAPAGSSQPAASTAATKSASSSSGAGPDMGGMLAGAPPMDGGPMPPGGALSATSGKASGSSSASSTLATPAGQVIQLLESRLQD